MSGVPILSITTFLPVATALLMLVLVRGDDEAAKRAARNTALLGTVATFVASLFIWFGFETGSAEYQFLEEGNWIGGGIDYRMGVDGISMPFIVLTTFLMPICILASWNAINTRVKEYMIAFLLMETLMIGVFCALDLVLFYLFFEAGLIPMFLIIGVWGGDNRIYASFKLFLYTLLGSVFMLVAILWMYGEFGTTSIPAITAAVATADGAILPDIQTLLWLAFFASFAVKMPMWPVHTWLPDAHVQAPTAGSVILAGVLLKMGGYGFLRFSLPMFPDASVELAPLVWGLSVVAVIYTSLVALVQSDMKKLIAYSSVAHMGFVTIGIFTFNVQGIEGGIMQMLAHGVVSGALFLCVGVVYDRLHTREIARYGGLVNNMPKYAVVFLFLTMAAVGLPGTAGFVGELLAIVGAFKVNTWVALLMTTGVILGAAYSLLLYRRVVFGPLEKDDLKLLPDLNAREIAMFAPIVLIVLWMGIYPSSFLDIMEPSVQNLLTHFDKALAATEAAEAADAAKMVAGMAKH